MTNDRYLFRGFHKDENGTETIYLNGEEIKGNWVYGYLVEYTYNDTVYINGTSPETSYIFPMDERSQLKCLEKRIEVIPETVGQYTGLDDKNKKKIFENDVCVGNDYFDSKDQFIIKFGKYKTKYWKEKIITERTYQFGWYAEYIEDKSQVHLVSPNGIKVIGTIFDRK